MSPTWGFPEARPREMPPAATLTDQFREQQTSGGFVTVGDTDAEVLVFSGRPDRVEVVVELNDVILSLRDRTRRVSDEITLRAGQRYEWQVRGDRLVARNATAGLNARVQVVGQWA